MARDIIDDRLIGSLHLRSLTHQGLEHDPVREHLAVQAGTIDALLAGHYAGDATIGDVLRMGDLGIGTVQRLAGELVILDGAAWLAAADGKVTSVSDDTLTPFAVACRFTPDIIREQDSALDYAGILATLESMAPAPDTVVGIRLAGRFRDLHLRSVREQAPPFLPLTQVVAHQTEWTAESAVGTLVGFRFPDGASGVEVPGYHLHFLSEDHTVGGHVLSAELTKGTFAMTVCDELHIELPAGLALGTPGATARATIAAVEG
ncbi:MAG: acetolactate decarboxylase [Actinomycetota bacterium]|nr:acetolactate decarboxylase [Actinomycetota bacterium]